MSHITKIKCDKCGIQITNKTSCYNDNYALYRYSAKIQLWGINEPRGGVGQRIDLCAECYEKFVNFLENGGTEEIL